MVSSLEADELIQVIQIGESGVYSQINTSIAGSLFQFRGGVDFERIFAAPFLPEIATNTNPFCMRRMPDSQTRLH
jgi:hypothetical protein